MQVEYLGIFGFSWQDTVAKEVFLVTGDQAFKAPLSMRILHPGVVYNNQLVGKMEFFRVQGTQKGMSRDQLKKHIVENTGVSEKSVDAFLLIRTKVSDVSPIDTIGKTVKTLSILGGIGLSAYLLSQVNRLRGH